jgi:hypothetical protein
MNSTAHSCTIVHEFSLIAMKNLGSWQPSMLTLNVESRCPCPKKKITLILVFLGPLQDERLLSLSCLRSWIQNWPLYYYYYYFASFYWGIQTFVLVKNLGPSRSSIVTFNIERWCQWSWETQLLDLENVFVWSYSFHIHFCSVDLFIFHVLLKEHNLQLWMLDKYALTFRNVFLLISFFIPTHSCEKSMICKFFEVLRCWTSFLLIG